MKKTLFTGAGVAIVTPFTNDGVDFDKLKELIEFQIREGTDALIVCGTTGECATMTEDEQKSVFKFAVETVNKRIPVIAGTGSNNTKHAIHMSKVAQELGCDGILSVTPYYNKSSQKGLYEHFKAIAESIDIPMILYNVPGRTGVNITPQTVYQLSLLDNVVAVKECNIDQVGSIVNLCDKDFSVYSGNDDQILPYLSLGAKGVISVISNIIPKDTHEMVVKFLNGETKEAIDMHLKSLELCKAIFIDVNPIPIKAAMNLLGMNVGKCRMPLIDTSEENIKVIETSLKEYGLI